MLRHGVIRTSTVIAAAWFAVSRPSGTPTTSGSRPTVVGFADAYALISPPALSARRRATFAGPSVNSASRQAVDSWATRSARNASAVARTVAAASPAGTRIPVSWPARTSAKPADFVAMRPISPARPITSPRPSSTTTRKRPGSAASDGVSTSAESIAATSGCTSSSPPERPLSGDAMMLRIRSCVADGSSPAAASRCAKSISAPAGKALIWMLAREVSSSVPSPSSWDAVRNIASWAAVSAPPGRRTRASPPSAAGCTRSAPGQRSAASRCTDVVTRRILLAVSRLTRPALEWGCQLNSDDGAGSRCESGAVPPL